MAKLVSKTYGDALFELALELDKIDIIQEEVEVILQVLKTNEEFIKMVREDNSEVVVLYGHVHSNTQAGYHDGMFHVGCDTNALTPISIQEVWEQCWPKEIMTPAVQEYKEKAEIDPYHE